MRLPASAIVAAMPASPIINVSQNTSSVLLRYGHWLKRRARCWLILIRGTQEYWSVTYPTLRGSDTPRFPVVTQPTLACLICDVTLTEIKGQARPR